LQNLMSATDVATLFLTTGLRINRFTPRFTEIFNVAGGDEGRPISDFTHQLEYNELAQDARRVLADLVPVERTLKTLDHRWFLMRMRPYRTLDDKIEGVVVTFVDVTDRQEAERRWEARQRLLVRELSHRVKNTLAVVQAISTQTLRQAGADRELQQTLASRLKAVATSHDLLVQGEWKGARLEAIAREQLSPYLEGASPRLRLEGPPVDLPSEMATPFGLLLHELATNASKYGALSNESGKVDLKWELIEGERGRRLRLQWSESEGPRVAKPTHKGFGTFLVERGLPEAQFEREFRPDGVVCTLDLPLPPDGKS
jgi:two-component system, chemotaxis family, CheB/CheR fusion protein